MKLRGFTVDKKIENNWARPSKKYDVVFWILDFIYIYIYIYTYIYINLKKTTSLNFQ